MTSTTNKKWSIDSWRKLPCRHQPTYKDKGALERARNALKGLPGLVTMTVVNNLRAKLKDVYEGKCFYLQGGHCAETFEYCTKEKIQPMLDVLAIMNEVLAEYTKLPVVTLGRLAGQYAKPRSSPTEVVNGVTMESFKGDLINGSEVDIKARSPDPNRMIQGYFRSAATMNFIRSSKTTGNRVSEDDIKAVQSILDSLEKKTQSSSSGSIMQKLTKSLVDTKQKKTCFTAGSNMFISHEGLLMEYEESLTREIPEQKGATSNAFNSSAHMLWIGHRTRGLDDAHVEYFRGLANPIGVKVGPGTTGDLLTKLLTRLNPKNEAGKVVLITRFGSTNVLKALPELVQAVKDSGHKVIWVCDPMHGNTFKANGFKTRDFAHVALEIQNTIAVHKKIGTRLNGLHLEMCGEDVTECVGGPEKLTPQDLSRCFMTACDPRLNFRQSVALSFAVGSMLR